MKATKAKQAPLRNVAKEQGRKDADDGAKQLDNFPVIFPKKVVAQARKRVGKTR